MVIKNKLLDIDLIHVPPADNVVSLSQRTITLSNHSNLAEYGLHL